MEYSIKHKLAILTRLSNTQKSNMFKKVKYTKSSIYKHIKRLWVLEKGLRMTKKFQGLIIGRDFRNSIHKGPDVRHNTSGRPDSIEATVQLPCFALFHFAFVFALKINLKKFFAKCFKSNINNIFWKHFEAKRTNI